MSRFCFTSTFPLLAHKKQSTRGVTGTEVSRLRPPASHTFSTSWSLLKSTLIRCTPSQGALDFAWPLVEGVLSQFKVLLLGGLVVSGFSCSSDKRTKTGEEGEYQGLYRVYTVSIQIAAIGQIHTVMLRVGMRLKRISKQTNKHIAYIGVRFLYLIVFLYCTRQR